MSGHYTKGITLYCEKGRQLSVHRRTLHCLLYCGLHKHNHVLLNSHLPVKESASLFTKQSINKASRNLLRQSVTIMYLSTKYSEICQVHT